jgi:hypothetical protein
MQNILEIFSFINGQNSDDFNIYIMYGYNEHIVIIERSLILLVKLILFKFFSLLLC